MHFIPQAALAMELLLLHSFTLVLAHMVTSRRKDAHWEFFQKLLEAASTFDRPRGGCGSGPEPPGPRVVKSQNQRAGIAPLTAVSGPAPGT